MTPTTQSVVVPDPLWMMHVIGPDDIYPAPDHAAAVQWCAYMNREIAPKVPEVLCVAVPAIWTGTAEEHAEGLAEAVKGWTVPSAPAPSSLAGGEVDWTVAAEAVCADVVKRAEDTCRKATDELYEGLLYSVQDYLRENVTLNLSGELERAYGYEREARAAMVEIAKAAGVDFVDSRDVVERHKERILAALSPEAPARDPDEASFKAGYRGGFYDGEAMGMEPEAGAAWSKYALTPRHEAPAELCKSCNGTGRELGSAFNRCADCEAPAEGAGEIEAIARAIDADALLEDSDGCVADPTRREEAMAAAMRILALRARSSAPEAREGEAAAEDTGRQAIWAVVHEVWQLLDDGETDSAGKATVDQERWQAVSDAMDKLEELVPDSEGPFWGGFPVNYLWPKAEEVFPASGKNLPATPSADKLRIAVEAMQGAIDWDKGAGYRMPYRARDPLYAAIDQAIPDALKGDAK